MLNYISAELYKLRRHKLLFVGVGLLLLLESSLFLPGFWSRGELAFAREALYGLFGVALYPMIALPPIFAALVFDDQHGHGTLKNEVVFGVPRSRIYLGKLTTAALAGTASALLVSGWFLLLAALITRPCTEDGLSLGWLLGELLAHWWVWMAVLAVSFLFLTLCRSAAGGLAAIYLFLILSTPFSLMEWGEDMPLWFRLTAQLFFTAPLHGGGSKGSGCLFPLLAEDRLAYSAAVGLLWVAGATALGLFLFRRREIK